MRNVMPTTAKVVCLDTERDGRSSYQSQEEMWPLLISISKSTRNILHLKLAEMGFQNGQDDLLFALEEQVCSTVTGLADRLAVRGSTMSKMVDTMTIRGLVERSTDPADSRRVYVRLTKEGLAARVRLRSLRNDIERDFARSLSSDEIKRMRAELSAIDQKLQKKLSRLR